MSLNCLKRLNHGKKLVLNWHEIGKSLFTFTKKKQEPKLDCGCRHLAEFTQHYKTGYFERPIQIQIQIQIFFDFEIFCLKFQTLFFGPQSYNFMVRPILIGVVNGFSTFLGVMW
jgi:hypothetical protein